MSPLEFFLLGPPRIQRDDQRVISPAQVRVFALGAYLAMESDHPCPRSVLAGLIWPDHTEERARHNLRQALSTLRRLVQPDGSPSLLDIHRDRIALRIDTCRIDARDLLALLDTCAAHPHHQITTCPACLMRLEHACALYAGPFLDGFYLPGNELYDEWLETWRQRLHDRVTDALDTLVASYRLRDDHDRAFRAVQRQLELDPCREAAHRQLMTLQLRAGNRTAALRQFESLRTMLEDELGVAPEPETVALYTAIRDGAGKPQRALPAARPVHLPVPPTQLIGREREQVEISDLLGLRDCRLLTLHGPGGSGKTRLAIAIAQAHADATGDIVGFVQLAGTTGAESVTAAIVTELGLAPRGPDPPERHLLAWLRERSVFLVLDNAEQLTGELGFIETMLATAPNLRILITSRERLGLAGEWIYDLPGLTYPRSIDDDSPEGYGAVALLAERIRQVHAGTPIDHAGLRGLVRICQLVEGMPLALEMAALWATTLTPEQIADVIRDSIDSLAASSRAPAPDRHQSMRAVFQSSWNRLGPGNQETFRRLSVFKDGFSLDAACQVAGADADSLAALINASMLGRDEIGRYRMHSLLSQFAGEMLREQPDEDKSMHERHAHHYLALIASQSKALNGLDQPEALRKIGDDLANILAAWNWAIDHGDVASLLEASPILWLYYVLRGQMHAGAETFDRLLDAFRKRSIPRVAGYDMLAAMTKCHAGGFISGLGQYDDAISLLSAGLEQFRSLISGRCISVALNMLAAAEVLKGDPDAARTHLQESLHKAELVRDTWSTAFAVNDLGMLLHQHFGEANAAAYCERGRQLFRQVGDVRGEALAAHNLGVITAQAGDERRALTLHREALALREALGDLWGVATSLVQLGAVSGTAGDRATPEQYLKRALRLAWESSILPIVLEALVELAAIDPDVASARTTLFAVARHPSVQEPVRARCESLLADIGESAGAPTVTHGDDIWAIHTVDRLAREVATS